MQTYEVGYLSIFNFAITKRKIERQTEAKEIQ